MDIGIGIGNTLLDMDGPTLIAWARRAEARGFASLASIGRVAWPAYDELAAFAAAAGLHWVAAGSSPPVGLKADLTALAIGRSRGSGGDRPCG